MKTKTRMLLLSASLVLSAGIASALTTDEVVKSYTDAAYSSIEVTESPSYIKVEAIKDGVKLEIVYDKASGEVLSREQSRASARDAAKTGLEVRSVGSDADVGDDDDSSDDNDDSSDDNDDSSDDDDDSGSDHDSDDDGSDDGDDSGSGHDGDDD